MITSVRLAHLLLKECIHNGDIVIDATAGNGYDTLFLSDCVGDAGTVIAIDIQAEAINATRQVMELHQRSNALYILGDHAAMNDALKEYEGNIAGISFNLGYLPGAIDHTIITKSSSTISALNACLTLLHEQGCISVIAYRGHDHGLEEAHAVEQWMHALPSQEWHVVSISAINQSSTSPVVYFARKKSLRPQ
ncbi:MAG: methyltransferase domain-containing protein [Ignavibacteria bacterium]|nr:methyltransferase domain-containing protein [Ignavibacteria bacterium]